MPVCFHGAEFLGILKITLIRISKVRINKAEDSCMAIKYSPPFQWKMNSMQKDLRGDEK